LRSCNDRLQFRRPAGYLIDLNQRASFCGGFSNEKIVLREISGSYLDLAVAMAGVRDGEGDASAAEIAERLGSERLAGALEATAVAASVLLLNGGDEEHGREIMRRCMDWVRQAGRDPSHRREDWRLAESIELLVRIEDVSGVPPVWPDWSVGN
jgi:hypothetical protein